MFRRPQVVDDLRFVPAVQFLHGLDLDDDLAVAHEVGNVEPAVAAAIQDVQFLLRLERNAAVAELGFERLLVDVFEEAWAERFVDGEDCAPDGVCLVLESKRFCHGGDYSILRVSLGETFPLGSFKPNARPI